MKTALEVVRMPFGVEYTFKEVPVGLFVEIAPSTEFIPDFNFNIRGGAGATILLLKYNSILFLVINLFCYFFIYQAL